jgi:hypothetical protein
MTIYVIFELMSGGWEVAQDYDVVYQYKTRADADNALIKLHAKRHQFLPPLIYHIAEINIPLPT